MKPVTLRIRPIMDCVSIDSAVMERESQLAQELSRRREARLDAAIVAHTGNLCALLEDRRRPTLVPDGPGFSVRVRPVLRLVEAHA